MGFRRILRKCGDAQDVQISFVHRNGLWRSFSCTNQEETGEIRPFSGDLSKETFFYVRFIVQTRFVQVAWFRSVFQALDKACVKQEAPAAVAFTCGPGLPDSLLVGPPSKDSGEPPIGIEFRSVQVSFVPEYFCKCPFLRSICARPHKSGEPQQWPGFLCTSLKSEASWQASMTPVGTASDTVQDRMGEAVLCKPQIRGFWITRMMREMK